MEPEPLTTVDAWEASQTRAQALARALERHPEPPPDAPEAVRRAWQAALDGYAGALGFRWADPNGVQGPTAAAERLRREAATEVGSIKSEEASETIRAVSIAELLQLEIPEREFLLEPWLREKEIVLIHAWRGVGKTHVGLNLAYAIASGGSFLGWRAPRPRRVLYIDGEMPARTMQERLAAIIDANPAEFEPSNLRFVCADLHEVALPNLSTSAGQQALELEVSEAEVIIVDSLSTLASHGRENDSESWLPMQAWALSLRRRGKTIVLFHHDGKGGQQRGTSRKEDILDVTIHLRRPADYEPQQGARFEVHFEKTRSLSGPGVEAFEATLDMVSGRAVWKTRKLDDARVARAAALYRDGDTVPDVMKALDVSRATAYRLRAQAIELGLLDAPSQNLNP